MNIDNPVAGFRIVVKAADEDVNNSAALQNDDELKLTVSANEVYHIEMMILATSATATPDINSHWTVPAGASITGFAHSMDVTAGTYAGQQVAAAGSNAFAVTGGNTWPIFETLTYFGGGTGGTVQWQWAQNAATAELTTVKAGSWIKAVKLK